MDNAINSSEPLMQIQADLIARVKEALQIERLDPDESFISFGADSIVLIEAAAHIQKHYGVKVAISQFFEGQETIAKLSAYIHENQPLGSDPSSVQAARSLAENSRTTDSVSALTGEAAVLPDADKSHFAIETGMTASEINALFVQQLKLVSQTLEKQNQMLGQLNLDTAPIVSPDSPGTQRVHASARQDVENGMRAESQVDVSQEIRNRSASQLVKSGQADSEAGIHRENAARGLAALPQYHDASCSFGLCYFGTYEASYSRSKYDLIFDSAKFADTNGFTSLWLPERHFHPFGGLSSNPSVLSAALAQVTNNIGLRAGAVLAPLHHPVRIVEEWAMVDAISHGRVGLSFASGRHANDFVLNSPADDNHRDIIVEQIDVIRGLWRGESFPCNNESGDQFDFKVHPQPMQPELPVWMTIVNNPDTYKMAGERGMGVLTNLMGQTPDELAANIQVYHKALIENGHAGKGHVAALLHTFVTDDTNFAVEQAREPLCSYLRSAAGLFRSLVSGINMDVDFDSLNEDDVDYLLSLAYQNYVDTRALIGSPSACAPIVESLIDIGVNEIGCLVDFGVPDPLVMEHITSLDRLRQSFSRQSATYSEIRSAS